MTAADEAEDHVAVVGAVAHVGLETAVLGADRADVGLLAAAGVGRDPGVRGELGERDGTVCAREPVALGERDHHRLREQVAPQDPGGARPRLPGVLVRDDEVERARAQRLERGSGSISTSSVRSPGCAARSADIAGIASRRLPV